MQQWHASQQQLQEQKQQQKQQQWQQASEGAAAAHAANPDTPSDSVHFAAAVPVVVPSGPSQHDTIDLTADSDDAEDSQGEAAAEAEAQAVAAAEPAAPAAAAAASAAAAAGAGTSGLTLGQLRKRYKNFGGSTPEKCGCRALSCLARLLCSSDSVDSVEEVQVSALLPHLGMLLQHLQQRLQAWGEQADDVCSGSSVSSPALSPGSAVYYVQGLLFLLQQRVVAKQFAGPEQQQQQALQQLKTVLAEFEAARKELFKGHQAAARVRAAAAAAAEAAAAEAAVAAAEAAAAAAAAGGPHRGGRSGPYRLQQLCDELKSSASPEAQQQLQLVTAWGQAICKGAGTYGNRLAPLAWLGRDPKLMLVQVCPWGVSGAASAVALALEHACDEPSNGCEANGRDLMAVQAV
jgi:hypothetical protein